MITIVLLATDKLTDWGQYDIEFSIQEEREVGGPEIYQETIRKYGGRISPLRYYIIDLCCLPFSSTIGYTYLWTCKRVSFIISLFATCYLFCIPVNSPTGGYLHGCVDCSGLSVVNYFFNVCNNFAESTESQQAFKEKRLRMGVARLGWKYRRRRINAEGTVYWWVYCIHGSDYAQKGLHGRDFMAGLK